MVRHCKRALRMPQKGCSVFFFKHKWAISGQMLQFAGNLFYPYPTRLHGLTGPSRIICFFLTLLCPHGSVTGSRGMTLYLVDIIYV